MLGEASGGVYCVYDLWVQYEGRRSEASIKRCREALDVSMVGGPLCAVTPLNASKVKMIRNTWKFIFCSYFF